MLVPFLRKSPKHYYIFAAMHPPDIKINVIFVCLALSSSVCFPYDYTMCLVLW